MIKIHSLRIFLSDLPDQEYGDLYIIASAEYLIWVEGIRRMYLKGRTERASPQVLSQEMRISIRGGD